MATLKEKAVQKAVNREKKRGKEREERHFLWILLALIALLLYLNFAQYFGWWPYPRATLGSAFYTNVSASSPLPSTSTTGSNGSSGTQSSGSSTSTTGSGSTSGGSTTTGGGSTGGSTGGTSSTPSIATFAAGIDLGDSKAKVDGQASGLGEGCAVVASANATNVGNQEVCTYTQGDKIVTVTYLNDHVISASKSGF